jgi:uncharacterized protein (TIGR00730 family)
MKSVTVYCASSTSLDPEFHEVAETVGREIARRGLGLVFGGGGIGLMGEVARAAKAGGARVTGIITSLLMDAEQGWSGCDELAVVETMRERKKLLAERGDSFLVLPGGIGTYEEFFEILVGRQLLEHDKPIGIVNAHGYYNPLVAMIEHGVEHRFMRPETRALFEIDPDPVTVLDAILTPRGPGDSRTRRSNGPRW